MKRRFKHFPAKTQAAILIEGGGLIMVNSYHDFSCYLYSYEGEMYELTWDNRDKKALIVRTVEGKLLDKYLDKIELPYFK